MNEGTTTRRKKVWKKTKLLLSDQRNHFLAYRIALAAKNHNWKKVAHLLSENPHLQQWVFDNQDKILQKFSKYRKEIELGMNLLRVKDSFNQVYNK